MARSKPPKDVCIRADDCPQTGRVRTWKVGKGDSRSCLLFERSRRQVRRRAFGAKVPVQRNDDGKPGPARGRRTATLTRVALGRTIRRTKKPPTSAQGFVQFAKQIL